MDGGGFCGPCGVPVDFGLTPGSLDLQEPLVVLIGEVSENNRSEDTNLKNKAGDGEENACDNSYLIGDFYSTVSECGMEHLTSIHGHDGEEIEDSPKNGNEE